MIRDEIEKRIQEIGKLQDKVSWETAEILDGQVVILRCLMLFGDTIRDALKEWMVNEDSQK